MKTSTFVCSGPLHNGKEVTVEHDEITTGYGEDEKGNKLCFECCAEQDRKRMSETGRAVLYLTKAENPTDRTVTHEIRNWPGSLCFPVRYVKTGRHNIAGRRYDAWFTFNGEPWHGVQYGDRTELIHCRRVKS